MKIKVIDVITKTQKEILNEHTLLERCNYNVDVYDDFVKWIRQKKKTKNKYGSEKWVLIEYQKNIELNK